MKLYGRLVKDTRIIKEAQTQPKDEDRPFRDQLEECLIEVCKALDIQVPLWLKKNTKEFANYHRTFFNSEHFVEKIGFDHLEIWVEQI